VKAIGLVTAIHEAQVISYLRLSGCRVGLLLNFHVLHLRDGVRRLVNEFPDSLRLSATSAVVSSEKSGTAEVAEGAEGTKNQGWVRTEATEYGEGAE
jgi:hypothetical protein